jgi:gamma-glutamyl phosphate reductase
MIKSISTGFDTDTSSIKPSIPCIPVLGHADGVCHVYVRSSADAESASNMVVDAKTA